MKHKRNTVIQLAILTVLGGAVILTMLLPRLPSQQAAAPLVEISVILRESDSSLWSSARLGMDRAAGELGAELRVLTLARTNDSGDQLAVLRREIGQQSDALVVVPADPAGLARSLAEAGVAVRGRTVDLSAPADALRDLLKQPDLSAVMVFEPALTEQAAALKDSLGLDVPLYGVGITANAAAWLEQGVIAAAGAWSDFAAGYLAVEGAVCLARGDQCHMEQLPFFIVRGEELYEPEYQKLLFPVG